VEPVEGIVIGQSLSHYRITAALGAGGMGEVYRATDTNLNRDVAIKVLPAEVVSDSERLARFRREAQLLAVLNHPHIAAIHGLEESDGKPFLSLELVEGEDLKQRLAKGAIPVEEALEIAKQIAEALEEAHGKGIVHRDLKPANVKLTPEGQVKVLDFGLAKAWAGGGANGSSSPALSQSPTMAATGTVAGVILGTAGYMSPEQARGKPVDKRADVWSFGVLLWEMLTGRTLFTGDTVTDVIAAVVREDPDLDALPRETPAAVRTLIARSLRKDPRTRLPDIGAARLELQDALAGRTEEAPIAGVVEGPGEHRRRVRERWVWAGIAVILAALAVALLVARLTETIVPRPPAHFVLDTPDDLVFSDFGPIAVAPDGRQVVFVGLTPGNTTRLWMRSFDSPGVRELPGTEGAQLPFWSPDSSSVAFVVGDEVRRLDLAGGTVQRICALPQANLVGGTWSTDGTIVFSAGGTSARLYSVPAAGGTAKPLTSHDESRGESGHWWPQFLPDGRHVLLVIGGREAGLYATSLQEPAERRRIWPGPARFRYAKPGRLLFVEDGVLMAQRFDADDLVTIGEAAPIASSVGNWAQLRSWGWFSTSDTGRVAWLSGRGSDSQLEWVDRDGHPVGPLGKPGSYGQIALSPDDRRLAVEVADAEGRFDLWVMDVARGVRSRLTTDPGNERDPVWSPDSQELVFTSGAVGGGNILRKGLQGSEPAAPLPGGNGATPGARDIAEDWSREGDTLLFTTIGQEDRVVQALSLDGDGPPEALLKDRFEIDEPQVSPDGHWLAFISRESGRYEVYVEPFRRRGERVRASVSGGGQPKWRGDGRELFYLSPDGALMAVDVRKGATGPDLGIPTVLVSARALGAVVEGPDFDDYAVTADGQRFLVKRSVEPRAGQRVHVLLDWPSRVQ